MNPFGRLKPATSSIDYRVLVANTLHHPAVAGPRNCAVASAIGSGSLSETDE
jgi:hypothetical protein